MKMYVIKNSLAVFILGLLSSTHAIALSIGEITNPNDSFLNCNDLKWYEKGACEAAAQSVSDALVSSGLNINNGDLVYRLNEVVPSGSIATGHSCSHTAKLKSSYANLTLNESGELIFDFESIDKPIVMGFDIPMNLYARINLTDYWGVRYTRVDWDGISSGCKTVGQDSYYMDASSDIDAFTLVTLSLEPKLSMTSSGDYQFSIRPIVDVTSSFEVKQVDWDMHGKSVLNGLLTLYYAGASSAVQTIEAAINKTDFKDELEVLAADYLIGNFQTLQWVGDHLGDDFLGSFIEQLAKNQLETELGNTAKSLEDSLTFKLTNALDLDDNGEKVIIIDQSKALGYLAATMVSINSVLTH